MRLPNERTPRPMAGAAAFWIERLPLPNLALGYSRRNADCDGAP